MNTKSAINGLNAVRCVVIWMIGVTSLAISTSAQGGPATPAQRDAKPQTPPRSAYRKVDPGRDGLDINLSGLIIRWREGGTKMDAIIDGITVTNTRGHQLQVKLASHSVIDGQIRTLEFGIVYLEILYDNPPRKPQLLLTNTQIGQIKKKLETAASIE